MPRANNAWLLSKNQAVCDLVSVQKTVQKMWQKIQQTGREYEHTHKWISFELDLKRAPIDFWLMLGEAQSKCLHLRNAPLLPEVAAELHTMYLARGVHATAAIEGNTLTEEEVRARIERKAELPKSKEYQVKEVDNILAAWTLISDDIIEQRRQTLCVEEILEFNRLLLKDIPVEDHVVPGEISSAQVGVNHYRGAPRADCLFLLGELCRWLHDGMHAKEGYEIAWGMLRGMIAHVYIAWIHPFGDGNGRTARLVELHQLIAAGVPSVAAHLLSNHYAMTREEYYRQLERASENGGDLIPFMMYALRGLIDAMIEQISKVQTMQLRVLWERHVYNQFRGRQKKLDLRRRDLMFAMTRDFFARQRAVRLSQIRLLDAALRIHYEDSDDRAIRRDLALLEADGLVKEVVPGWYQPNVDVVRSLVPPATPIPNASY